MRLCRFDAGAGGYRPRETETETETGAEAGTGTLTAELPLWPAPSGTTARSAIIRTPSQLIVHARLVRNVG